ncbi:hypothetical protein MXB_661 [Myxobolus squamalis]|nr:hypothetical protein MXB_661 [Myxobolus squamalis]
MTIAVSKSKLEDQENIHQVNIVKQSLDTVEKAFKFQSILNFFSCLEACEIKQQKKSIIELESKLEKFSFLEKFESFNLSVKFTLLYLGCIKILTMFPK